MRPEEDRAGVVDLRRKRLRVAGHDLEMLGREPLDERQRGLQRRTKDDRAVIPPARAGDFFARKRGELPLHLGRGGAGERRGVGDEDGLRGLVMLRLRKQIGRDEARVGARIGEDDDLRRPGDHVDADDAEHPPFRRRDIGVAGSDNLVDRRDASAFRRRGRRSPARRRPDRSRRRRRCAPPPAPGD